MAKATGSIPVGSTKGSTLLASLGGLCVTEVCYRSDMQAQAWTAIGLLAATLLGVLFYLGNRIDYLGNRIDTLGSEVRGQFQTQGARIDNLAHG